MNFLETGIPDPRTPHLGLICGNMSKPTGDKPALLTHNEVETVFHEFGQPASPPLVRCQNQVTRWCQCPLGLRRAAIPKLWKTFAGIVSLLTSSPSNYETGQTIPDELFDKMIAARNYMSASAFMRQLSLGKLDLELHVHPERYFDKNLDDVDLEILADYKAKLATQGPSMARRFKPSFLVTRWLRCRLLFLTNGPRFSMLTLSPRFREDGVLNQETGMSFRKEILSQGNSRPRRRILSAIHGP